jgi:hypothetical protein
MDLFFPGHLPLTLSLMLFSCDINKSIFGIHISEILILSFLILIPNPV